MSILTVKNVSHSFGGRTILKNVSFALNEGEHIGLIGPNGEGKSTFLKIILKQLIPDEGTIEWAKRSKVGYLDQYTTLTQGKT
ncbi:MAG: ATP-binding cassette domain-containing protein, partial [Bacilli bacterium]|nr:ATP-binding cassette domain-containing protein [Bacilli bacterium]